MSTPPSLIADQSEAGTDALYERVALLERRTRELVALTDASRATNLAEILGRALDAIQHGAPAPELQPAGAILLIDRPTGKWRLAAQRGLTAALGQYEQLIAASEPLNDLNGRKAIVTVHRRHDPLHLCQSNQHEPHGHIAMPLIAQGHTAGALLLCLHPDYDPENDYVEFVAAIMRQASLVIEQQQLNQAWQTTAEQLQHAIDKAINANELLDRTKRELQVTYDLTMAMQSTQDVTDIQERVLTLITNELGFDRAILALADLHHVVLTGWVCSTRGAGAKLQLIPHTTRLPLTNTSGLVAHAVLSGRPLLITDGGPPTDDPQINAWLGMSHYAVLPMVMRNRPLGVLLIDNRQSGRRLTADDLTSLANIARQSSMVIGSLQLCIDRTQRLAVEEERSRIAMEIHDAISQQLYGITYTLDACVKILPEQANEVLNRLTYLLPQAQQATAAIRRAIFDLWPDELDAERFAAELRGYAHDIAPAAELQLRITITPRFDMLAVGVRKQLYRIAQEALTNIIKHAHAHEAEITLATETHELRLTIADDGQGFDTRTTQRSDQPHFGLNSMRERAHTLGGQLQIQSHPRRGTRITVTLPYTCRIG